jgi:Asp/Glu/hydantoin racemase
MHAPGESEELIGNTNLSSDEVDKIFRKKLHENAVPVAKKMLEEDEAKAVLFGCTLWGGMIHEINDNVDALCLDPIITAVHFAEFQASLKL